MWRARTAIFGASRGITRIPKFGRPQGGRVILIQIRRLGKQ